MGFFGKLIDGAKRVGSAIKEGAKAVWNTLTGKTQQETSSMRDTASSAATEYKEEKKADKSYMNNFSNSFDRNTSSVSEIERTEDVLRKLRRSVKRLADKMEKRAFEYSRGAITYIIDEFKDINNKEIGGKSLNLNLESLKNSVEKLERDNKGFIKNYTDKRVSLDDDECVDILEIKDKDDRADKMEDFKDTVVKEALEELGDIIKDGIELQTSSIFEKIESRLADMEDMTQKKAADVDNIQKMKQQDDDKLELKIINVAFDTVMCDLAMELVNINDTAINTQNKQVSEVKGAVSIFERKAAKSVEITDSNGGLSVGDKVKIKSGSKNYFGGSITEQTAFSEIWTITKINGQKIYLKNNSDTSLIVKDESIERNV